MNLYEAFQSYVGSIEPVFSETGRPWYDPAYIAVCVLVVLFIFICFRFLFSIIHAGGRMKYE